MEEVNLEEIKQTWNKIEKTSRKAGLREGISDGRNSNFQENFDIGLKEGFKNGFVLGKYKGLLAAYSKQNSLEIVKYPLLEKTSRGGCVICKTNDLLEEDVSTLIKKQTEETNKHLKELHSTFNKTFNCQLPNSVDTI